MNRVILICFLFLFSMTEFSYSQMSGLWTVSDTSYAEYGIEDNRFPCIASSGEESVVLLANKYIFLPHYLKRSTDKGHTWEKVFAPANSYELLSVANPSKNVIVITGDTTIYQGSLNHSSVYKKFGFITVSEDGGKTWNPTVLDSNCTILCLSMYDSQNGIAVKRQVSNMYYTVDNRHDTLLVTNDCWKSFKKVILPDNIVYSRMSFCFSDKIFYIINFNKSIQKYYLYKTFDCGVNWEEIEFPDNVISVTFYNNEIGWACGTEYFGNNKRKPVIYKTENGFADYQIQYPTTDEYFQNHKYLSDISFSDSLNGIAVGSNCIILRTSDAGITWQQDDLPNILGYSLRYETFIIAKSVSEKFAIAIGNNNSILKYEGVQVLASPSLKNVPSPVGIYNIPIEWSVVKEAEKYHFQLAIENSGYYNTACYDTAMVLDTIIYASLIDTLNTMMKIIYPEAAYNSNYYARVKAINSEGESQWGENASIFWTYNDGSKITAPKFKYPLDLSYVEGNKIVMSWTNSGAGLSYDLQIDASGDFTNMLINEVDIKDTTIDLASKLPTGKSYRARVRVHPAQKFSDWTYITFWVSASTDVKQDHLSDDNLMISPNPATDFITINLDRCATLQKCGTSVAEIYDMMGILIQTTPSASQPPLHEGNLRIDVSNLPPGVYFVKIGGSNGASPIVEKFVKM